MSDPFEKWASTGLWPKDLIMYEACREAFTAGQKQSLDRINELEDRLEVIDENINEEYFRIVKKGFMGMDMSSFKLGFQAALERLNDRK